MKSQWGVPAAGMPHLIFFRYVECVEYVKEAKYTIYPPPRVHCVAVDMFGRSTADTLIYIRL